MRIGRGETFEGSREGFGSGSGPGPGPGSDLELNTEPNLESGSIDKEIE